MVNTAAVPSVAVSRFTKHQSIDVPISGRRVLLIALPTLGAFGPLIPVVDPFYAFRIAAILYFVLSAVFARYYPSSPFRRYLGIVALAWLGLGALLIPGALNRALAVEELFSVAIGIFLVASVAANWTFRETLRDVRLGWLIAFIMTGIIGTREKLTGSHLSNYVTGPDGMPRSGGSIAGTFSNPNQYAVFLAVSIVLLLSYVSERERHRLIRLGFAASVLWCAFLLVSTGGRLALAAAFLGVLTWLIATRARSAGPLFLLLGVGLVAAVALRGRELFAAVWPSNVSSLSLATIAERLTQPGSSGDVRINITLEGVRITERTFGIGAGPGNFAPQMQALSRYDTQGVFSPHNGLLEIAAQYGLVLMLLVLFALLRPASWAWRRYRAAPFPATINHPIDSDGALSQYQLSRAIVLCLVVEFLPLSLANSSLWVNPLVWLIAAVFVAAALTIEPSPRSAASRRARQLRARVAVSPTRLRRLMAMRSAQW